MVVAVDVVSSAWHRLAGHGQSDFQAFLQRPRLSLCPAGGCVPLFLVRCPGAGLELFHTSPEVARPVDWLPVGVL